MSINELTLELFQTVASGQALDEDGRQRVFGWLSALMQLPYLDETETENALTLLEYLEGLEGGEVFAPMYRALRARLSFVRPPAWEMDWPENYQVAVEGQNLSPEDLRRRGIGYVDFRLTKPIRSSLEYVTVRRLHSDGTVELLPEYEVFTAPAVGGRHMFHVYGEKAVAKRDR